MKNKLTYLLPRHPLRSLGYTLDYFIAFLPSIIITYIFTTKNMLAGLLACLVCSLVFEFIYSFFTKKELDITLAVRVLLFCICIPCNSSIVFYILGGILIFLFSNLRRYMDKYISLEPVLCTILVILLFIPPVYAPTHSVVSGVEFGKIAVWDLLVGFKTQFFGTGSIFALAFAYIYLSIRKRISFLRGLLFYIPLIATLAFMYEDGGLNAIYYVSFIALDARVFFGSLFLLNSGILPFEKKGAYLFSIIGGVALGIVTLKLSVANGIYFVLTIMSIIARPVDLLIFKLKHTKKDAVQ